MFHLMCDSLVLPALTVFISFTIIGPRSEIFHLTSLHGGKNNAFRLSSCIAKLKKNPSAL